MGTPLFKEYIKKIQNFDDRKYLFLIILYHISPTIAKLKPSTIITLSKNIRELNKLWEIYKSSIIEELQINYYEIKNTDKAVSILFFYKENLIQWIYEKRRMDYLNNFGYRQDMDFTECMDHLKNRFENVCPHEIGIFLGIPIEDVKTFIEFPERECLLCGYWKVYFNLEEAKDMFKKYDTAKCNVIKNIID